MGLITLIIFILSIIFFKYYLMELEKKDKKENSLFKAINENLSSTILKERLKLLVNNLEKEKEESEKLIKKLKKNIKNINKVLKNTEMKLISLEYDRNQMEVEKMISNLNNLMEEIKGV